MADTILQKIVARGHCRFADRAESWQEAVRLSAVPLVESGYVSPEYVQAIVDCIERYGPYVVFAHQVAMPHAQERAEGVYRTGVGFLRLRQPVSFGCDTDGAEKQARLLFTLAAADPEEHLDNLTQLVDIFSTEALLDALMEADTPEAILAAEAQFPPVSE